MLSFAEYPEELSLKREVQDLPLAVLVLMMMTTKVNLSSFSMRQIEVRGLQGGYCSTQNWNLALKIGYEMNALR